MDLLDGVLVREIHMDGNGKNDILFFPKQTKDDVIFDENGYASWREDIGYAHYIWRWDEFHKQFDCNFKLPISGCMIEDIWMEV